MFANIKFKYIYFYKLFSRIRMVRAMPAAAAGAVPPAGLSPPKTLLLVPTHTHHSYSTNPDHSRRLLHKIT